MNIILLPYNGKLVYANFGVVTYRTICILYGLELLLDVFTRGRNDQVCNCYIYVPLPCSKELWEPIPDAEWSTRYHEFSLEQTEHPREFLNIGSIRSVLLRPSGGLGNEDMPLVNTDKESIANWCEKVDELGILVWAVIQLETRYK